MHSHSLQSTACASPNKLFHSKIHSKHLKLIVLIKILVTSESLLDNLGGALDGILGLLLDTLLYALLDTLGSSGCLCGHALGLDGLGLLWGNVCVDSVRAVLLDELGEVLDRAVTRVLNWLALGSSLEQLDGGKALNLIWNVVEGGINLGDGNLVGVVLVHASKLIVLWCESLAVSTPWCVELEENILLAVDHNLLVVLGHDNGDWAILLLWDRLAFDGRLNLASNKVLDEASNLLLAECLGRAGLGVGELLVLGGVLDSECGPCANLEVEVASVLAESAGVNGSEVDLALVLLSNWLEGLGESLTLLGGLGEDVGEWDAGLKRLLVHSTTKQSRSPTHGHVISVGLWSNLANQGSSRGLGESKDVLLDELLGESVLALVESLVENNRWLNDALSLGETDIRSSTKEVRVTELFANLSEGGVGSLVVGTEETNNDDLVGSLELVQSSGCRELGDSWQSLLGHV